MTVAPAVVVNIGKQQAGGQEHLGKETTEERERNIIMVEVEAAKVLLDTMKLVRVVLVQMLGLLGRQLPRQVHQDITLEAAVVEHFIMVAVGLQEDLVEVATVRETKLAVLAQ